MRTTFRFEQWISCISSCALYSYATSVHSIVMSLVNSRYIISKIYTGVTLYLLAAVRRPARVQQRPLLLPWRHWSWPRLEFPEYPFWLWNRASNVQCGDGQPYQQKRVQLMARSEEKAMWRILLHWFFGQTSITMTEDHVSSLFYCYSVCLITINLNSIAQSDQSSLKTFCESLCSDRKLISFPLLWRSANDSRRTMMVSSMITTWDWQVCLKIIITAHGQRPQHHLHCKTSGQISSLFCLSD